MLFNYYQEGDPVTLAYFQDFTAMMVFHMLFAIGVSVIINRCHVICLELHKAGDQRDKRELCALYYLGTIIFWCVVVCALRCSYQLYELQQQFYFQFLIKFIVLLSDLVYSLMWCLSALEAQRISRLPGQRDRLAELRKQQRHYKMVWVHFKAVVLELPLRVSYCSNGCYVCNKVLFWLVETGTGHSLLGYELKDCLELDGVTNGDFHETNKDCVVCFEEMVHNDKVLGSVFDREDAVKIPCGHIFHHQCLMQWLQKKKECPTCRALVVDKNVAFNEYLEMFTEVSPRVCEMVTDYKINEVMMIDGDYADETACETSDESDWADGI